MITIFTGNLVNLGDALIALRQATYLRTKGHQVTILPYEEVSHELQKEFINIGIKILPIRKNPIRSLLLCFRSHIIYGGGHMIRKNVSLFGLLFCILAFIASRAFGHRIVFVGIGATPVTDHLARLMFRAMLALANTVYARDPSSKKVLTSLAPLCKNKIHLGGDMAYLGSSLRTVDKNKKGICAISPAVDKSENRTIDTHEILNTVIKLKHEGLERIILIPHDLRSDFDIAACQEIKNFLAEKIDIPIDICVINTVTTGLISAYESASWVITSRLHGLILSSMLGKQVFYTSKSAAKLKYFADFFGYPSAEKTSFDNSYSTASARELETILEKLSKKAEHSIAAL